MSGGRGALGMGRKISGWWLETHKRRARGRPDLEIPRSGERAPTPTFGFLLHEKTFSLTFKIMILIKFSR